MKCIKCSQENPKDALFCMKCGAKLERRCPNCGSEYPLEAIFCMKCGTKVGEISKEVSKLAPPPKLEDIQSRLYIPQQLKEKMQTAAQQLKGENRLVTVMFADISGFTPASEQLSPEQLADLANECFKAIVEPIFSFEGNINRFIGDSVLALFGAPIAHENDPERAILAALDIVQAMQKLKRQVTIGINTGTMYVGPVGVEAHQEYTVEGYEANLAQRLQASAKPGQIIVGEGTYRATRSAFEFEALSPLKLKGISKPVIAYKALKALPKPEKIRGVEGLKAEMVGRDRELVELRERIDNLLSGRGQIVSIMGEAGIGKSRLVTELQKQVGDQALWLEGRCVSYGQAMNYSPFRSIIGNYLGILPTDTEVEAKAKLHAKVNALLPATHRWIPIHVGHIFFPQYEQELRTASGDDFAKQRTYPIMRNLFQKIAEEKPLVLVFEDLHWADPSSLALLEYLMEGVDEAPILYCWVYRPVRDSECWRLRERAAREFAYCSTEINLSPLSNEQTDILVRELLRIPDIPERIRVLIQRKASGNPLYVEEIIHSFIDYEVVARDGEYWRATMEAAETEIIPSETLQGVILARVDRLEREVKETLQLASVVGDSFPLSLLEKVSKLEQNLSRSLRELERAELLQRRRIGAEWEYQFRHPLIHDVVYQSLLLKDRSALHQQIGAAIEALYAEKLDDYTDILAHHYGNSKNIDKALHYLTLAGDKAKELRSYWEALDYYGAAMEKAEGLEDERQKKQVIVDLVVKRSGARHMLGCLREDVEEFEKYVEWAEEIGDREKADYCYFYLIVHNLWSGEKTKQIEPYLERLANIGGDKWTRVDQFFGPRGERLRTYDCLLEGNYEAAIALDQQTIEIAKEAVNEENNILNIVSFFNASCRLAKAYRMLGQWSECLTACQAALDLAIKHAVSASIIQTRAELGSIYLSLGEWEKVIVECETALNMSPSGWNIQWVVTPLGDAYCKTGQLDKGIELLERWKAYAKRTGRGPIVECEYCLPLAESYLAKGERDKARANAEEALQIAQAKGYPLHEAQAHRILGEILAETDFRAAEEHFRRSLEIMQRIKAKNEEGKTELSWGKACQQHGDVDRARLHLSRAAEIFEELGTTRYLEWTNEALANLG